MVQLSPYRPGLFTWDFIWTRDAGIALIPPRIIRFSLASPIPPILHTHISSPTGVMEL